MAKTAKDAATRERGRLSRPQDVDVHIGARIRERRIVLGLTQQQMAELIGVTYEQVHKYERGINRIAAGRLYMIARALGVKAGAFFNGLSDEDPAFKPPPQHRMLLDLARTFMTITNRDRQREACELVRALADNEHAEKGTNDLRDPVIAAPVKFITKLMEIWAIDEQEVARLLGLEDEQALSQLASGAATLSTRDMKDRVRHLLRMREALHSLFRDSDAEREWLREPRPELNGQSPLALLLEGSMENFLVVSQFVQWMAGR
jgi:transcriptional regulator with XRE-family HTH domain